MGTAIFRFYPDCEDNEKKELVSTAFWFREVFSINIVVFMILLSPLVSKIIFKTSEYYSFLIIAFLAIPFALATDTGIDVCRLNFKRINYGAISLFQSIGRFFLIILLVVCLKLGLNGLFWAGTLAAVIVSFIAIYSIKDNLGFIFSKKKLRVLLRFGLPLVFTPIALWVSNSSDRFFLVRFSGLSETGLYAIGYKLALPLGLIVGAFQLAFSPIAYTNYREEDAPEFFNLTFAIYNVLIFGAGIFIALFSIEILHLLVPATFYGGYKIVGFIVLATILHGVTYFTAMGVNFAKKTEYLAYAYVTGAGTNILFNSLLIPKYGMMGAAVATMASFFIMALLGNYWGRKMFPRIPMPFYKVIIITLLFLILYIFNIVNPFHILSKTVFLIIFILALLMIFKKELLLYKKFIGSKAIVSK
jgi:O-antigen/teichoic acid export membrane protein